jgi:hypothetical protein
LDQAEAVARVVLANDFDAAEPLLLTPNDTVHLPRRLVRLRTVKNRNAAAVRNYVRVDRCR